MEAARSAERMASTAVGPTHSRSKHGLRGGTPLVTVVAWVTLIYGVSATTMYVAGRLFGDATGWLYVSNLSTFYWLTPALGLFATAIAARWWLPAAACLVPVLAWLATFGPVFVPNSASTVPDLRVVSYNMQGDPDAPGVGHVVRLVERTAPDILLLQEVAPFSRERLIDGLSAALTDHHFARLNPTVPGRSGTAVFSRLPIRQTRPITGLPAISRPTDIVTLDAGERALHVVSLHLVTPDDGCKVDPLSKCVASFPQLGRDAALRRQEVDRVIAVLPPGPLVIGGDLNSSTLNSPRRWLVGAGLVDLHRASGAGLGFTAKRAGLGFRIDWLFASGDVTAVREWVGPLDKSDHRPVVADVVLP